MLYYCLQLGNTHIHTIGVHLLEKAYKFTFKSPMMSEVEYLLSETKELSELVTFRDTNEGLLSTTRTAMLLPCCHVKATTLFADSALFVTYRQFSN